MTEVLFPRTDGGVAIQVVLLVVLVVVGLWSTRHRPDGRLVVVGAGLVLIALVGMRAAH